MAAIAALGAAGGAMADSLTRIDIKSKSFGDTRILGPIGFEISKGETIALIGPSGIGKSTLLRLLAGLDIKFDGKISRPDAMAMVFQEPTLLPWRSARDNVGLVHPGLTEHQVSGALERVGLSGKEDLFPGQLSLGQQRRLSLARATAGTPELLILDEPFVSLDESTAETMLALTEQLISDLRPATLLVTHNRAEADRLADRQLVLTSSPEGAILSGA